MLSVLWLRVAAVLGVLVSAYALYVERAKEQDSLYVAACDFGGMFSCSAVLTSEYAHAVAMLSAGLVPRGSPLDQPNALYGLLFYFVVVVLSPMLQPPRGRQGSASAIRTASVWLLRFGCLASIGMCFFLAYVLAFILHDVCVVCISMYVCVSIISAVVFTHPPPAPPSKTN